VKHRRNVSYFFQAIFILIFLNVTAYLQHSTSCLAVSVYVAKLNEKFIIVAWLFIAVNVRVAELSGKSYEVAKT